MRRLHIAATTIVLGLMTGCVEMQRTCNSQEMIAMKDKGFSVEAIDNMCTSYKVKEESIQAVADVMKIMATPPRDSAKQEGSSGHNSGSRRDQTMSNLLSSFGSAFAQNGAASCTTQFGSCPLSTRAPAGLACQCQTPFGSISGVTQ